MLRTAVLPLLVLLLGLVAGCGSKDKGVGRNGGTDSGAQDVKGKGEEVAADLTISATELYAAYKSDPQAADQRYKGKRLAVTGKVGTRDDQPRNRPKTILFGLKGSSEKNEYVACYFPWESERFFYRLDAKPMPPIIGTCEGAATSEYGKKDARPMEVRLTKCVIPEVPGVKSPYDKGFAEGTVTGTAHMREFKVNAQAGRDTIRKTLKTYSDIHDTKAANMHPGGAMPSDVDRVKGMLDGYQKAVEPSGVK
jgi:hypothetical protein